jgi:hypothetical protein
MYQTSLTSNRITVRFIIAIYILLFLLAIVASGYFLAGVIQAKPVELINLLKYILLCSLFLILLVHSVRAMSLRPARVQRLADSTKNFKWLFTITFVLLLLFRSGLIKTSNDQLINVNNLQTGLVIITAFFCFWSDTALRKRENIKPGAKFNA